MLTAALDSDGVTSGYETKMVMRYKIAAGTAKRLRRRRRKAVLQSMMRLV
ncbi:MAG: hypothetical protein H7Y38_10680 [Armatimonadetes bacterium]|nr:hypothetical protein [Armatimonadota bacterium]